MEAELLDTISSPHTSTANPTEHVTYMSVAKAAHVTVRLSQEIGRQL